MTEHVTTQNTHRHDWTRSEVGILLALPLCDLIHRAQTVHRTFHDPNLIQISMLLNIKKGGCPEDCAYCAQSAHYDANLVRERLMPLDEVLAAARRARDSGATRFCMGAAWRSPRPRDLEPVLAMIQGVKALGLETCVTLGMLDADQAQQLKEAGLDYYNHNLDTAPEFYGRIVTTRTYQDRLDTLARIRAQGIRVCCGGIIGLGENREERASLLVQLANLPIHPESVPINLLVRMEGTPLSQVAPLDSFEIIRTIAVTRIMMPTSLVRLSAGREQMNDEAQALSFLAGANSIFHGERLLTTSNVAPDHDRALFERLGLQASIQPWDLQPHGCTVK
ncbi:biotin synthase [Gammaproteobacteria bacterium]